MPQLKHLNYLDYFIVVVFLAMVAGVGIYVARYNKKTEDYFKAGGKLPWVISGLSLFVSGFSAFMFVSASGFTYKNGISSLYMFTSAFGAYWLGFFVFGKLWRRARISSPMQLLTRRYSQSTTYFYSVVTVLPNILLMGTLIYTLCIFISSAFGFNDTEISFGIFSLSGFEVTLVVIGLVLLFYTVLGGLWAVAVTDTIQFIIMLLMTLIVFPASFMYIGDGNFFTGFSNLAAKAPEGFLSFSAGKITFIYIASFWVMNSFGYNVNWHIGQRYYAIADERDTRKMAAMCAILGLVAPLLWVLPVLSAKVIFPDLQAVWPSLAAPEEASFVSLCLLILPHGFLGVVVSAIVAASMSSADSTFNWLAAVVTKDLYVPVSKKLNNNVPPSDRAQLLVGKGAVLVIGLIAIMVSLLFQKIGSSFDIYMKIYSMTTPALFVPVMFGMIYRKTPWWSAIAASSSGIIVTIIMNIVVVLNAGLPLVSVGDIFADASVTFLGITAGKFELNVILGILASSIVFFASSLWPNTAPEDKERLALLDADLSTPAYSEDATVDQRSIDSYRMVAKLAGMIGILLFAVSAFSGSFQSILINCIAGAGAIAFYYVFNYLADHYQNKTVKPQD